MVEFYLYPTPLNKLNIEFSKIACFKTSVNFGRETWLECTSRQNFIGELVQIIFENLES